MKHRCGVCGERTSYTHIKVPPTCIELMEDDEPVDLYDILGLVRVWFCPDHWDRAKEMVSEGENPLSEVSTEHVSYESRSILGILAGDDIPEPSFAEYKGIERKMLERSLEVINEYDEYTTSDEVVEAKIIFQSLKEMDVVDDVAYG